MKMLKKSSKYQCECSLQWCRDDTTPVPTSSIARTKQGASKMSKRRAKLDKEARDSLFEKLRPDDHASIPATASLRFRWHHFHPSSFEWRDEPEKDTSKRKQARWRLRSARHIRVSSSDRFPPPPMGEEAKWTGGVWLMENVGRAPKVRAVKPSQHSRKLSQERPSLRRRPQAPLVSEKSEKQCEHEPMPASQEETEHTEQTEQTTRVGALHAEKKLEERPSLRHSPQAPLVSDKAEKQCEQEPMPSSQEETEQTQEETEQTEQTTRVGALQAETKSQERPSVAHSHQAPPVHERAEKQREHDRTLASQEQTEQTTRVGALQAETISQERPRLEHSPQAPPVQHDEAEKQREHDRTPAPQEQTSRVGTLRAETISQECPSSMHSSQSPPVHEKAEKQREHVHTLASQEQTARFGALQAETLQFQRRQAVVEQAIQSQATQPNYNEPFRGSDWDAQAPPPPVCDEINHSGNVEYGTIYNSFDPLGASETQPTSYPAAPSFQSTQTLASATQTLASDNQTTAMPSAAREVQPNMMLCSLREENEMLRQHLNNALHKIASEGQATRENLIQAARNIVVLQKANEKLSKEKANAELWATFAKNKLADLTSKLKEATARAEAAEKRAAEAEETLKRFRRSWPPAPPSTLQPPSVAVKSEKKNLF